jgi:hypothetical protein
VDKSLKTINAEITAREEDVFMRAMEDHALIKKLGIVGVSPYDPPLQAFLTEAFDATTTDEELVAYVAEHWNGGE